MSAMAFWKQLIISAALLAGSALVYAFMTFGPGIISRSPASASVPGSARPAPLVVLSTVESATDDNIVKSIGTARAIEKTTLYPEASGRVEKIGTVAGQQVNRGDIIVQLDNHVQQLAVDRALIAVTDAKALVARYETLAAKNTVSDVQLRDAVSSLENARLDLSEARDTFARRAVRAPFSGDVGLIEIGVGDYVTTATAVTSLDDRSILLIEFRVPERFANQIGGGQSVTLSTPALPGLSLTGEIAGMDSRIDSVSRTLTVQGTIENDDDLIRPGMSFEVVFELSGSAYPSVPSPAVQWDRNGSYVLKAKGNRASRTPVDIVSRQPGRVLVSGDLLAGDAVVSEGTDAVRPDQPFRIFEALSDNHVPDTILTSPDGAPAQNG
jgi:RND family efflux transporter MFP subunit